MAEDTSTITDESTSETEEEPTEQEQQQQPKSSVPPEVAAALKKANKEAETLRRKLKEIEDAGKTETQRATDEAAAAKAEAAKATRAYLRLKVGTDAGLPPALASRLQGETEEEMTADAAVLLKDFKPKGGTGSFEPGARQQAPAAGDMNQLIRRAAGRST